VAVEALLGYYLADRRTDDGLLGEVLALWAEHEELTEQAAQRALERGVVRGGGGARAGARQDRTVLERYLLAWRRWLDQQAQRAPVSDPGDG
jgi:hypothetical protein